MLIVVTVLLHGIEAAKACTITGRSTEKPNGYGVVRGNVWPELITVGTAMRPMALGVVCGEGHDECKPAGVLGEIKRLQQEGGRTFRLA
jgi:hypothetical protein